VDKITGPGNAYVASAKKHVFGQVGIDMIAGPSEILVLADGSTPPDWVAMDLFSQAEHDELAQSILLCPDAGYIDAVQREIDRLLPAMPRPTSSPVAERARRADPHPQHGRGLRDQQPHRARAPGSQQPRAAPLGAAAAPCRRHLPGRASPARAWATTAPAPTTCCPPAGTARFSSPLGVYDFQKRSSLIEVSAEGADQLGRSPPSWPKAWRRARGRGLQPRRIAARPAVASSRRRAPAAGVLAI
jgi:histidinol dehydrogenase